jgi:plasmid stabilization system protein ParE
LIRYSEHAEKRLAERSILAKDVESTIRDPLELAPVRYGRQAACRLLPHGRFLVVFYEQEEEDFIVVTAVKTDKEGARRYGFIGV